MIKGLFYAVCEVILVVFITPYVISCAFGIEFALIEKHVLGIALGAHAGDFWINRS